MFHTFRLDFGIFSRINCGSPTNVKYFKEADMKSKAVFFSRTKEKVFSYIHWSKKANRKLK